MYDIRCHLFAIADLQFYICMSIYLLTFKSTLDDKNWATITIIMNIIGYIILKTTHYYENLLIRKLSIYIMFVLSLYSMYNLIVGPEVFFANGM